MLCFYQYFTKQHKCIFYDLFCIVSLFIDKEFIFEDKMTIDLLWIPSYVTDKKYNIYNSILLYEDIKYFQNDIWYKHM